jgi:glutamine amidotransferase
MIAIVDYGLGNIQAFLNVYKRLNIPARAVSTSQALQGAQRIVLPGVGAFDHAMESLDASGMRDTLERMVQQERVPVLGVCVGMQMLADGSDEGRLPGLGWIPGQVRAFASQPAAASLPLPHMGWNDVSPAPGEKLFAGMEGDARFYFLHSFYFECEDATAHSAAQARYGVEYSCAVRSSHIAGVQFHPEKSHHWGTQLLKNFATA